MSSFFYLNTLEADVTLDCLSTPYFHIKMVLLEYTDSLDPIYDDLKLVGNLRTRT